MQKWAKKQNTVYLLFLLPAMLFFAVFFFFPFLKSLWLSFTDAYGYNPEQHFIGLKNYIEAIKNPGFLNSLKVTVIYTLFVSVFANLAALGFSFLLDGSVRFKKIFRAVFFLPNLMSLIIVSFIWVFLYGSVYRSFVELLSIPETFQISWLGDRTLAVFSIGITAVWQCAGYYMLIYIAALQNIGKELVEAAKIDGAGTREIVRYIKFPQLIPVIGMNTVLLITSCFKTFDIPMAMTSGGPAGATTTIALQIYNTGFRSNRTGYATAQSVLLFLIISMITVVLYWFQNRREENGCSRQ